MTAASDVEHDAVYRWEFPAPEVARFVVHGDLDLDVREQFTRELYACPPGSVPHVDIDLTAVTFCDARSAEIVAGYRDEAGDVRLIGASGTTLYVLRTLGMIDAIGGDRPARPPMPVAELLTVAQNLVDASREIVADSRTQCARSARLRQEAEEWAA